jgi:hypothetical protein
MISADEVVTLQDEMTCRWHELPEAGWDNTLAGPGGQDSRDWMELIARQHRANFDLWHIEDEARAPDVSDAKLAAVKRRIDKTNQLRNDLAEELDRALLTWLEACSLPKADAPLCSETPGLIIDRLSILALKIFHTREEAERAGAPTGHAERNRERLMILKEQRADLAGCLDAMWRGTLNGTCRFKLYLQLKMYNDPTLNPSIYGKSPAGRSR